MSPMALSPRETARRRLLDCFRREGPLARVEIGQHLGMSPASVSDLTASLLDEGILVSDEAGEPTPGLMRGRPKVRLLSLPTWALWSASGPAINRIELRLVDSAGRNRASRHVERPLRTLEAEALLDVLARTITSFAEDNGGRRREGHRACLPGLCGHPRRGRGLEPGARDPRPPARRRPEPAPRQARADRERRQRHGVRHRAAPSGSAIRAHRLPDDRRWRRPRLPGPGRTLSRARAPAAASSGMCA